MANETASKKRQDEDEIKETHRQEQRSDAERRQQQNLNQGSNTGTEDVQRVSDWGSTRSSKRKGNGKSSQQSGTRSSGGNKRK